MASLARCWLLLLSIAPLVCGCKLVEPRVAGRSPLRPVRASADSVTVEIFFARCPQGDPRLGESLWKTIDEQKLPAELRKSLAQSGFRAGVLTDQAPGELVQLLKLTDAPKRKTDSQQPVNDLQHEPTVTLRRLQARGGQRNELIASKTYDQLPLLTREDGNVRGRTYNKAEGRFALKVFPLGDGRARFELIPELFHGEQAPRWTGSDGIMRLDSSRPKHVFDELRTEAVLAPGEMLVVTSLADRPGSLGHYFFTEPANEALTQKLMVIRLANVGQDELFDEAPAKTLDLHVE